MNSSESKVVDYLKTQFELAKKKNPRYSLRTLAKKIGIPAGNLSEMFAGKRSLKTDKAELLLQRLISSEKSLQAVRAQLGLPVAVKRKPRTSQDVRFLFDWVTHVTLGFFELGNSKVNAAWISQKIGLPVTEIQLRIDQLVEQGHLVKDEQGRTVIPERGQQWTLTMERDEATKRKLWTQQIRLADHALNKGDLDNALFSSITFLGSQEQIDLFKSGILMLYDRVVASAEVTPESELVRISVQAFPVNFKK